MHLPILSPTDPALLPDVNKTGPDPENRYRMYLVDPELEKDDDGNDIPQMRPFQLLVDPIYGEIGYYDKTRGRFHINCIGDVVFRTKNGLVEFVPQPLEPQSPGAFIRMKPSIIL